MAVSFHAFLSGGVPWEDPFRGDATRPGQGRQSAPVKKALVRIVAWSKAILLCKEGLAVVVSAGQWLRLWREDLADPSLYG